VCGEENGVGGEHHRVAADHGRTRSPSAYPEANVLLAPVMLATNGLVRYVVAQAVATGPWAPSATHPRYRIVTERRVLP
jgi:hypothetical protein